MAWIPKAFPATFSRPELRRVVASIVPSATASCTSAVASMPVKFVSGFVARRAIASVVVVRLTWLPSNVTGTGKSGTARSSWMGEVLAETRISPEFRVACASAMPPPAASRTLADPLIAAGFRFSKEPEALISAKLSSAETGKKGSKEIDAAFALPSHLLVSRLTVASAVTAPRSPIRSPVLRSRIFLSIRETSPAPEIAKGTGEAAEGTIARAPGSRHLTRACGSSGVPVTLALPMILPIEMLGGRP